MLPEGFESEASQELLCLLGGFFIWDDRTAMQGLKHSPTMVFSANLAGCSCLTGENKASTSKTEDACEQTMFSLVKHYP